LTGVVGVQASWAKHLAEAGVNESCRAATLPTPLAQPSHFSITTRFVGLALLASAIFGDRRVANFLEHIVALYQFTNVVY